MTENSLNYWPGGPVHVRYTVCSLSQGSPRTRGGLGDWIKKKEVSLLWLPESCRGNDILSLRVTWERIQLEGVEEGLLPPPPPPPSVAGVDEMIQLGTVDPKTSVVRAGQASWRKEDLEPKTCTASLKERGSKTQKQNTRKKYRSWLVIFPSVDNIWVLHVKLWLDPDKQPELMSKNCHRVCF